MWQVENRTPFAAAGDWVRDRDGAEVWLVAVRCTFLVRPDGTTVVADEQDPPVLAPKYRGDPATSQPAVRLGFLPDQADHRRAAARPRPRPGGKADARRWT